MKNAVLFLVLIFVVTFSAPASALAAVTVEYCSQISGATASESDKTACKALLSQIDQQILAQQRLVELKQAERQSLERDVSLLEAEIKKSQLGIQARSLAIRELNDQIGDKVAVVSVLDERSEKQKQSISSLIRKTQEIDDNSLAELMLTNRNFSEFFADFEDYRTINNSLRESVQVLAEIRRDTEEQMTALEEKQLEEARQRQLQEAQKAVIEEKEEEKSTILEVTKGQEAVYQQHLAQSQRTAAQLRAALFDLAGGGGRIPFTEAVQLAKFAGAKTGVSPSFILAILEQESEFGSNIGQCTYNEIRNGRAAMGPGSVPVYTVMADVLGFDISTQKVSCPLSYGWGGAMGPSQFIPSTWALYGGYVNTGNDVYEYNASQDSIRQLLGITSPSSPFRNQDAFLATSLLMRDNGAAAGSYDAEWTAAIRYYSGWNGINNARNHFYGDQVMERKARLEAEIRTLDAG